MHQFASAGPLSIKKKNTFVHSFRPIADDVFFHFVFTFSENEVSIKNLQKYYFLKSIVNLLDRLLCFLFASGVQGVCWGHSAWFLQLAVCAGAAASRGRYWLSVQGYQAPHQVLQYSKRRSPRPVKRPHRCPHWFSHTGRFLLQLL